MVPIKLVSNQISPNLKAMDVIIPFCAQERDLPQFFTEQFGTPHYKFTNSARTALAQIIDILDPDPKKKIALPAFICGVVATPFLEAGYQIEWIDTDENGLISLEDFRSKMLEVSLVVVPHIFGQKAPLKEIYELAHERNIWVVEDGAHLFEPGVKNCDAKVLSFGREKVFSCVSGGALLWPENSLKSEKFKALKLENPARWWVFRHWCQPIVFSWSLWWWRVGGKVLPWLLRKIWFLPVAVSKQERKGHEDFPQAALSCVLQKVLRRQFVQKNKRYKHAQTRAGEWKSLCKEQFPEMEVIVPENYFRVILKSVPTKIKNKIFKVKGFHLTEWNGMPIAPKGVDLEKFGYTPGQCPNAERFASNYVTFPTNIRTKDSDIKTFAKKY